MPPKGVKSPKRKRQYEHIKRSVQERGGRSAGRAKEIAARTVNKQRRKAGQPKKKGGARRSSAGRSRRSKGR
jgi:hypothetical protein